MNYFRHRKNYLLLGLISFGMIPSVHAAEDIRDRCSQDQLISNAQAIERNLWAANCGYFGKDPDKATRKAIELAQGDGMYIVFTGRKAPEVPTDRNVSCDGKTGWVKLGYCFPGCYTPFMELLFDGKMAAIGETRSSTVTAFDTQSSNGKMSYKEVSIGYFATGIADEEIYLIQTKKGRRIELTSEHPLVKADGSIVLAKELTFDTPLLDQDGEIDLVSSISTRRYQGPVWNVAPSSKNKKDNILVAQGLLTGSHRFQSEWAGLKYRLDLRETLDVSEL